MPDVHQRAMSPDSPVMASTMFRRNSKGKPFGAFADVATQQFWIAKIRPGDLLWGQLVNGCGRCSVRGISIHDTFSLP
jgi:hypothetical protein